MRIVERIPAHYEAQEVEFGKSYKWCPEQVVVECGECKKRITSIGQSFSLPSSPADAVQGVRRTSGKN